VNILDSSGEPIEFNVAFRNQIIRDVIENMASDGLRTIALAYRDFPADTPPESWDYENVVVNKLTCICIAGIEDPVRPEVRFFS